MMILEREGTGFDEDEGGETAMGLQICSSLVQVALSLYTILLTTSSISITSTTSNTAAAAASKVIRFVELGIFLLIHCC